MQGKQIQNVVGSIGSTEIQLILLAPYCYVKTMYSYPLCPGLKEEVFEGLHAAHHRVVPMTNCAQEEFIWLCITAIQNAPSNPMDLPEEPVMLNMPFESVHGFFSDGRVAIFGYR